MLKKSIILVLALLVVSLTVVSAQTQADADAMLKLTEDFMAGRITMPEFERRMAEITSRMEQQAPQVPQQQPQQQPQQRQPQEPQFVQGWPSTSTFSRVNLPNLRQPVGITPTYKVSESGDIEIDIKDGTRETLLDLVRQIQTGTPSRYHRTITNPNTVSGYTQELQMPSGKSGGLGYFVDVRLYDSRLDSRGGIIMKTYHLFDG